uniref:Succinate dehydrogenase assembly factor 2, mitochondrial (Trinotate prediction) n=1 Tax=Myxobolus squamalis TaxID=59785 RepID=A0A6B2GA15_MYXSQ
MIIKSVRRLLSEVIDVKRKRLLYQSRKRGTLENCLILSNFADKRLAEMSENELKLYDDVINNNCNEWDLYRSLVDSESTLKVENIILKEMIEFTKNNLSEDRTRQPNL